MKQTTFASLAFDHKKKLTKREQFLREMDQVVPWETLTKLIAPHYPKAGNGRPPMPLATMLRIYFLQQWFNLSDPAAEDSLYDIESMRRFAGIELGDNAVPDETTILNFRRLLERHRLTEAIFQSVNRLLAALSIVASRHDAQRKQGEEKLRDSERQFRALIENLAEIVLLVATDGTILYVSPSVARLMGYQPKELVSANASEFVHPDDRKLVKDLVVELLRRPEEPVTLTYRGRHKDGSWRWVESVFMNLLAEPAVRALVINARDITKRRQVEEQLQYSRDQLRAFASRLQAVREEERTRIAREIHDELGQTLTGLKMDLAWLDRRVGHTSDSLLRDVLLTKTQAMIQLINTTIQTVRRIATELRPGVLDNLGLLAALEWQAQDFAQRMDLPCRLMTTLEEVEMEPERSIAVFRIFQEALTNIARHAQATAVDVKLSAEAGNLTLEVHDNGRGITEDVKTAEISLGLLGMRERALAVGGNLAITGASGQGTTITVCMPLGKREEGGSRGAGERESGRTGDGEKSALS